MSTTEYRAHLSPLSPGSVRPPRRPAAGAVSGAAWVLGGLIVLGAVLRFTTVGSQSYWADEALTVYEVHLPFGSMLSAVAHLETTPPLYFILAWAWAQVFGLGEAGLRSLSAVAGVAVIPITYLCARDLISRRAGLIAAALATVNPFLIWYSQEARSYMLLIALTGASLLWAIRSEREPSRRHVVLWAVFSALALATHFFAGFLIAPEALWLLWSVRSRLVVGASVALGAVQVALLPLVAQDTGHGVGWIHAIPRLTRIAQVPTEFGVMTLYRHVSVTEGLVGGAIVLVVGSALIAVAGGPEERRGARIAGAMAAVVILVPLVLGLADASDDVFLVRNLSPAWIPLAIVLGAACAAPRARDLGMVAATVLLVLFVVAQVQIQTEPVYQRADWRGVAHALGTTSEPRAILVAGGAEADALKVMVPRVRWNQPLGTTRVLVDEVDVVGSIARAPLRGPHHPEGRALPRDVVRGAILLGGNWVRNFYVTRYELVKPWRFDTVQISARAGRFFRQRAPKQLLILLAGGHPRTRSLPIIPRFGLLAAVTRPAHPTLLDRAHRSRHRHTARHRHRHRHRRRRHRRHAV